MTTMNQLVRIGPRPVMQIVPTLGVVRPVQLHNGEQNLADRPLTAPTGPGGAPGFRNVAGSQILVPQTTNVYLGPFWGDRPFVERFSQAIVENGYLDPLRELHYGTGAGKYLGAVDGPALAANSEFRDSQAKQTITSILDRGAMHADENSLFLMILPEGVTSVFDSDGSRSCSQFCGYHDAFTYSGTTIAYAVLPSTLCTGCGGKVEDFTAVYAHELAEAITDKVPGQGWVAADGEENGDLEAWTLLGWGPPEDPQRYTIQGYYTNERGNTVGKWRDSAATSSTLSTLVGVVQRSDLTPALAQQLVVDNTPDSHAFHDPDQQLLELGVIDDVQAQVLAARIQGALSRSGWHIKRSDVDSAPATQVSECADSVLDNAF